ncbi:hypothetical protein HPB51_015084 [Rhipicephalus microplus]|uniref:Myosin motor domain-containing protein n=1 Tax=Rhipicephalus microplus TaxID=6941 RepID=A0A9J6ETN4_RHIMP|nr:hypothetical protein HPB51_015084 [Rhipicephalus microplus]
MSAALGRGKNTPVGTGLSANERATSRRLRSPRGSARGAAVRISRWADDSWTSEPRFTLPEFVVGSCPGLVARPPLCSAELCTSAAAVAPSAGIRVRSPSETVCSGLRHRSRSEKEVFLVTAPARHQPTKRGNCVISSRQLESSVHHHTWSSCKPASDSGDSMRRTQGPAVANDRGGGGASPRPPSSSSSQQQQQPTTSSSPSSSTLVTSAMEDFEPGQLVWFDPGLGYSLPGEVIEFSKPAQVVTVQAVVSGKAQTFTIHKLSTVRKRQDLGTDGVEDMVKLADLSEAALLWNLKIRYDKEKIYTYTGSILVAVNPYKMFDVYGVDVVNKYQGQILGTLPPDSSNKSKSAVEVGAQARWYGK